MNWSQPNTFRACIILDAINVDRQLLFLKIPLRLLYFYIIQRGVYSNVMKWFKFILIFVHATNLNTVNLRAFSFVSRSMHGLYNDMFNNKKISGDHKWLELFELSNKRMRIESHERKVNTQTLRASIVAASREGLY